eukprot:Hpha_TRINITY_DN2474_c0_g1::TRINITY_DN2474_c0_g1_i1::g.24717::m.24717/K10798/PARP; poly [ADP-ribose] polymerase
MPLQWLWESDDGSEFKPFSGAYGKMLEGAYEDDPTQTWDCKMRGHLYHFDFKAMTQTNAATGSSRRIQRKKSALPSAAAAAPSEEEEFDTVLWKDDAGGWRPFDAKAAAGVLKHKSEGDVEFTMKLRGWDYKFNLKTMTQKNIGTGTSRSIKFEKKGSSGAAAAAAPKSKPSSGGAFKHKATDEGHEPPAAKSAKTGKSGFGAGDKIVKKGRGVVDKYSGLSEKGHILEEGKDVYMCMLNQTNIGSENNNKFYVVQVVEADGGGKWWTWNRWGRIGAVGQSKLQEFGSKEAAKHDFCHKFRDKTKNHWADRESFVKHSGKYQLMDIDYGDEPAAPAGPAFPDGKAPDSTLPKRLQRVMELISDRKMMTDLMTELEIDVKKMPLGKISKKQVKEAFAQLKRIESELTKGGKPHHGTLVEASSQFYTLIPHDVGYSKLPVVESKAQLEKKMAMLDALADLEIAVKVMGEAAKMKEHPFDATYAKMKTKLTPLDKSAPQVGWIEKMVKGTHAKTHGGYTLSVEDVFCVDREGEADRFKAFEGRERMMLWHGSRVTNWVGILSQGLRIAPPEAPVTGYMFGKGVYFADIVSKSANYCHASKDHPYGFLILSDVATGAMHDLTAAKFLDKPPPGHLSVRGVGRFHPNGPEFRPEGKAVWPQGPIEETYKSKTDLLYNEFIVYDVSQVRVKYLVMIKFHFKY